MMALHNLQCCKEYLASLLILIFLKIKTISFPLLNLSTKITFYLLLFFLPLELIEQLHCVTNVKHLDRLFVVLDHLHLVLDGICLLEY